MVSLLCSCGTKEIKEKINYEQNGAIEFLKTQMKSPTSFQVVSVRVDTCAPYELVDTLYHISKIYKNFYSIDKVYVDEAKLRTHKYPARNEYHIEYDAANSFGAILRERATIIAVNGEYYNTLDFYKECYTETTSSPFSYGRKIVVTGFPTFSEAGCWVDWVELFIDLD